MAEGTRGWYAVQTYSGHEQKVQRLLARKIEDEPGETPEQKEISESLVPTQEVTEIRNGKRVQVTKRLYPGYILVNMVLNERTQHVVNSIQGVIKFVSAGGDPKPLRDDEINKITHENAMREYSFDPFAHRPKEKCTAAALRAESPDVDVVTRVGRPASERDLEAWSELTGGRPQAR